MKTELFKHEYDILRKKITEIKNCNNMQKIHQYMYELENVKQLVNVLTNLLTLRDSELFDNNPVKKDKDVKCCKKCG